MYRLKLIAATFKLEPRMSLLVDVYLILPTFIRQQHFPLVISGHRLAARPSVWLVPSCPQPLHPALHLQCSECQQL
jgi:hypothetical protein